MSQAAQAITRPPTEVVRDTPVSQAPNGICYAVSGEMNIPGADVERMVSVVPKAVAAALERKAYYFVPLTVNQGDQTVIADRYDVALSDSAVCHRNLELGGSQCVFISTRLMDDKFSIAFEFYINVGHAFVERAGVSQDFADLVWKQAESRVRGETSLDAMECAQAFHRPRSRRREAQERLLRLRVFGRDLHLSVVDVSRRGLLQTCASATIPCSPRLRWPSACARLQSCSRRILGFEFAVYYRRRS